MLVDMHLHEKTFSTDSFLSLDEIVSIAKAKGLDAVCITDHDSMGLRETAEEYTRRTGFPIFTGIEFFSLQGDITAWGLESYPDHRIPAQDFIDSTPPTASAYPAILSATIIAAWRRNCAMFTV